MKNQAAGLSESRVQVVVLVCIAVAFMPVIQWSWTIWNGSILGGIATALLAGPMGLIIGGVSARKIEHLDNNPSTAGGGICGVLMVVATVTLWFNGAHGASMLVVGTLYICAVWSWFLWRWGPQKAKSMLLPTGCLLLILPWEAFLKAGLQPRLQAWTADLATLLLRTLNYDVWKYDAYTIDSKPYYVIVNETCSGINMMVALLVYILVFGWLAQSKWQTRVAMVALVFPLAMLVNSLRVTCIYLLGYYGGVEWADGFWHTGSAYLLFIPIFFLIFVLSRALDRRFTTSSDAGHGQ